MLRPSLHDDFDDDDDDEDDDDDDDDDDGSIEEVEMDETHQPLSFASTSTFGWSFSQFFDPSARPDPGDASFEQESLSDTSVEEEELDDSDE